MKLSILGSTGSIGTQALEVCGHIEEIEVVGLSAHSNITLLEQQARKFKVKQCTVFREDQYKELKGRLKDTGICVSSGSGHRTDVGCRQRRPFADGNCD